MTNDLVNRFTYHKPHGNLQEVYAELRAKGLELALLVDVSVPECREKSLAVTKIEEAIMWANAGIARNTPEVQP